MAQAQDVSSPEDPRGYNSKVLPWIVFSETALDMISCMGKMRCSTKLLHLHIETKIDSSVKAITTPLHPPATIDPAAIDRATGRVDEKKSEAESETTTVAIVKGVEIIVEKGEADENDTEAAVGAANGIVDRHVATFVRVTTCRD